MDVGGWLRGLGLERYNKTLRDAAIDMDVLADLTDGDLERLGLPLGDRKRLLKAIAALSAAPPATEPRPPPVSPGRPKDSAERRPITVLFCDLVGSTSLASRLDAEDWRSLVNSYLDEASAAVTAFGGHVLKKLGDGLMALFGYPRAQENDAERAVRAALAIQRALVELNASNRGRGAPELAARIGIEGGLVVVDATGEVFGEAPNIAARVQAAAEPGAILTTRNIQRQVAGLFVAEEQPARELKGVAEPVALFRIVRACGGGRRGGARTLTPFVGREEELSLLMRRWERARAGEGQLVMVVGEPGLGKSRLVQEFHGRLGETPHTWVEWGASQLLQNTPLHPIAEWGRQRFGAEAPAEQRLADLEETLRVIGLDPQEHAPLLAPLVDIPVPAGRALDLPAEELRRRQMAAMTAWVMAGARTQPVVLAFEDLHWADPTSLDLLRGFADRGAQAPFLLLATTRPEFHAPWSLRAHHSVLSLSPLDRAGVARMVNEISARHALSSEVIEGVSDRTGGVPLFVEEVTRLLLERGEQGGVQAIPPTLQQLLAARLDRLGAAREVAQIGAVLGRDFTVALLRDVTELGEPLLQASLDRLVDANFLFVEGAVRSKYRFKHALIQDAAYEGLLKSRRQALHKRAAETRRDDPERAAAEPEIVAYHFTQAGLDDLAVEWWGRAGDQALRRSAFQEAIAHLGKAIATLDSEGEAGRRLATRIDGTDRAKLRSSYATAVLWGKGVSADGGQPELQRAPEPSALLASADDEIGEVRAQWDRRFFTGEFKSAQEVAERALPAAEAQGRIGDSALIRAFIGATCLYRGDLKRARALLERALADSNSDQTQDSQSNSGTVAAGLAGPYLPLAAWHLGDVIEARRLTEEAEQRALDQGGLAPIVTLLTRIVLEARRSDPEATLAVAERAISKASENGVKPFIAVASVGKSWAIGRLLDPATGALELERELQNLDRVGLKLGSTFRYCLLADLEALAGNIASGLRRIEEGLAISIATGERWSDPDFYRLRGDLLLKADPRIGGAAEDAYQTSIAIAKEQGARSYVLLSSLSLAKLYRSTGRATEALAVLAPALEGFAPTPEMPEIAEAHELFERVAQTNIGAARQR